MGCSEACIVVNATTTLIIISVMVFMGFILLDVPHALAALRLGLNVRLSSNSGFSSKTFGSANFPFPSMGMFNRLQYYP